MISQALYLQREKEKETAKEIRQYVKPTVIADFGKLELYGHDYHWLLAHWFVDHNVCVADCEVEFYPTYALIGETVFPYDVENMGTEREELLLWVGAGKI